jgi:quinolinate synthase
LYPSIINRINRLKKERDAVILAHTYQPAEIQDVADYVGDSLGLSLQVKESKSRVIVFCGVKFMAETAKIISPDKTVLLPDTNAGCPMADMITADQLRELKKKYPGHKVVCYVNSSAEVKAESDICCTSSNAVKVVSSFCKDQPVIFIPDINLGTYVKDQLRRDNMIIWNGFCHVHHGVSKNDLLRLKQEHPAAITLVHPECRTEVIEQADYVLSTTGMIEQVGRIDSLEFIIVTESGILYPLRKKYPDRHFYNIEKMLCPNMKKISIEALILSLENYQYQISLPKDIIDRAGKAVSAMLAL